MADMKSCEGLVTTLECMECGYREVFTERQFKTTDGYSCYVCNGMVIPAVTKEGAKLRNRLIKKQRSIGELTLNIDVTDALKGLKDVQREARKAAQALKEVEDLKSKYRGNE